MQQIINFLIRSRSLLWFLFLLLVALGLTVQSHNYHTNKFITSTGFLTGGVYSFTSSISNYFNLKSYNERLLEENTLLKEQLENFNSLKETQEFSINTVVLDTSKINSLKKVKYSFFPAEVINSTYNKKKNYLTLNKGKKDGILPDMGVVTDKGIVGIVENVSNRYSTVISLLNENSKINAQLKRTNHFGSLVWNGENPYEIQLIDIPRLAPLYQGDTIITGGRSTIFPKGIPIGKIKNFKLGTNESYYTVNVELFNDMTNIGFVQVIENNQKKEIKSLEAISENE